MIRIVTFHRLCIAHQFVSLIVLLRRDQAVAVRDVTNARRVIVLMAAEFRNELEVISHHVHFFLRFLLLEFCSKPSLLLLRCLCEVFECDYARLAVWIRHLVGLIFASLRLVE